MKKHLKLISLLSLFVIATTTFFIFAKRPADDKPETIMVRVYPGDLFAKPVVAVYNGGDKIEKTEFSPKDLYQSLFDIIQKLNLDGYRVISQSNYVIPSGGGGSPGAPISGKVYEVWVLTKK